MPKKTTNPNIPFQYEEKNILKNEIPEEEKEFLCTEDIIDISKSCTSNHFLVFSRLPSLIYYVNSFSFPSTTNRRLTIPRPQHNPSYYVPGHVNETDDLNLMFLVDENYKNYFSILKWMRDNENTKGYMNTTSRASLIILNNAKMPIIRVDFYDTFPVSLGELQFDIMASDVVSTNVTLATYSYGVTYLDGSFEIPRKG